MVISQQSTLPLPHNSTACVDGVLKLVQQYIGGDGGEGGGDNHDVGVSVTVGLLLLYEMNHVAGKVVDELEGACNFT